MILGLNSSTYFLTSSF